MTYVVVSGDCGQLGWSIDDESLWVGVSDEVSSFEELAPDAG